MKTNDSPLNETKTSAGQNMPRSKTPLDCTPEPSEPTSMPASAASLPDSSVPANSIDGTRFRARFENLPGELIRGIIRPVLEEAFEADYHCEGDPDEVTTRIKIARPHGSLPLGETVFAVMRFALFRSPIRDDVFSLFRSKRYHWTRLKAQKASNNFKMLAYKANFKRAGSRWEKTIAKQLYGRESRGSKPRTRMLKRIPKQLKGPVVGIVLALL